MTVLLAIDGATNHVRRYETRRAGGRVRLAGEGVLVMSSPTLHQGIEAFREHGICGDDAPPPAPPVFPQDHIPPAAA